MLSAEVYNKKACRRQKTVGRSAVLVAVFLVASCAVPKRVAIRDVCLEPEGTTVSVDGFVSLPRTVDTVQLSRGGRVAEVGYQLLVTSDGAGTGDSVKVTLWATESRQANRIKAVTEIGRFGELTVYANDGRELGVGEAVRITGVTVPDVVSGCAVTATKVDLSDAVSSVPEKAAR